MEKYTIDIDKVLDEFEESEALEQEQCQAVDCSLSECDKVLKKCEVAKAAICTELFQDSTSCKSNCSNYTNSLTQCSEENTSGFSENGNITKSDYASSVQNTVFQQTCTDSNIQKWSYDVYKPFQCPCNLQDNLSPCLKDISISDIVDQNCTSNELVKVSVNCAITAVDLDGKISCASSQRIHSASGNFSEQANTVLSSGCSDLLTDKKETFVEHNSTNLAETPFCSNNNDNVSECFNISDENQACDNSSNYYASVSENGVSSVRLDNLKTPGNLLPDPVTNHSDCESDSVAISVTNSNTIPYKKENMKSNADTIRTVTHQIPPSKRTDKLSYEKDTSEKVNDTLNNVKTVCFSPDAEEPNISLEDMNEYLNDLDNSYQIQDEDSGVSSQEDMNGNNISSDVFESPEELHSKPVEVKCEASQMNEICPLLIPSHAKERISSEDDVTSSLCNNALGVIQSEELPQASEKHQVLDNSTAVDSEDERDGFTSVEITNKVLGSTFPKKTESPFSLESTAASSDFTSVHELSFGNLCTDTENQISETEPFKCLQVKSDTSSTDQQEISNCVADKDIPAMKLVFFPNDGTFHSVPSNQVLTSDRIGSADSFNKHSDDSNFDKCIESDASSIPENLSCASRLQRPTTLDLPCQGVGTTNIVTSYIDKTLPSSSDEASLTQGISDATDAENPGNEILSSKIGKVKPFWIPDSSAVNCMHCGIKFTVIKRRHHCRACGKVLCSRCCNQKARLPYLSNKEERVCQQCAEILAFNEVEREKKEEIEKGESPISSSCGSSPSFSPSPANSNFQQKGCWRPHPNNPDDYCSTVSPLQQVQELANRPPPTVMVPVGVLKRGNKPRGVPKQVIFSDGIRPGGDLTDPTETVDTVHVYHRHGRRSVEKSSSGENVLTNSSSPSEMAKKYLSSQKTPYKRIVVSDSEGPLPPILLSHGSVEGENLDLSMLFSRLQDDESGAVVFAVTKNLHVLIKITKLDCCFGKECWCFTSHGLCTVGQDEVVLILERFCDEDVIPRDAFRLFSKIYDDASKGMTVGDLGHLIFPDGIFGSWEHRGFLFVRPTFQCLKKLILPSRPYLFALLIQKWEVPWARVFPLRLMLRLGAECRYYPCSLVSVRFRKPLYFEIGQTIMSVLADLRNFQFTIPFVPGLVVLMEEKKTCVNIPRNRYDKLMKVLNSNNVEHVLSLGSNFSSEADSHLVCMQKDEGDYQTRAINIEHTARRVTGASFIVFTGALKSTSGLSAKFSIVEDGLLVEIPQETMCELRSALRDMRDLVIKCGQVSASEPEEVVIVQWTAEDKKFNIGVTSPIDNRSLEGVTSLRIHTSTDYAGDNYLIRWTEVFFMETDKCFNSHRVDSVDPCRIAETIAQAFCMSLIPYLDALAEAEMTKIGLRVTLDAERDMVEYDVGSLGQNLPSMYMNALDSSLIPVLSRVTVAHQEEPIALELMFYILIK